MFQYTNLPISQHLPIQLTFHLNMAVESKVHTHNQFSTLTSFYCCPKPSQSCWNTIIPPIIYIWLIDSFTTLWDYQFTTWDSLTSSYLHFIKHLSSFISIAFFLIHQSDISNWHCLIFSPEDHCIFPDMYSRSWIFFSCYNGENHL